MSLKGHIKDLGLVDLVQVFHNEKKTLTIHLGSELGYGKVCLLGGELVHAQLRDLSGKEALWALLGWHDGDFEVSPGETATEVTINGNYEALILDGLRQLDESNRTAGQHSNHDEHENKDIDFINNLLKQGILVKE